MIALNIFLFGGRGAKIGIKSAVPHSSKAIVNDDKIYKYYLQEGREHYKEFYDVGYRKENGEQLRQDLINGLMNNPAEMYERDETGYQKAIVYMELGIDKKRQFKTVWGKKDGEKYFKNVTAYRYSSKRKK